jgi:EAL domain-containing protein (putative c-di-GMP-specific phosphodiesterase class I)
MSCASAPAEIDDMPPHVSRLVRSCPNEVTGDNDVLAALLESVDVAVVACDMNGQLTHVNRRGLDLMRMDSVSEAEPSTWVAQVAPRTPTGRPLALEELPIVRALQGEVVADVDLLIRTPGGEVVVNTTARPIFSSDGTQLGAVAIFDDVTVRRAREAAVGEQLATARLCAQLQAARRDGRLAMFAQPIVTLAGGEVLMQELLLRVRSLDGTMLAPGALLAAAERTGSIGLVDEWALEQALTLAEAGSAVSVNLSADSLGRNAFVDLVDARIARTGVDPSPITFEITETAVLADVAAAARFAGRMKALGCRFALDDFGTGYAALTYLKEIPFDYIKIDVDFVRDLHSNGRSRLIVEGVVAIARCVGQQTIAEGVEDAASLALLRELGVDHAQGFLLGRPRALPSPADPGRAGPEPRAGPASASSLAGGPACRPPRSPARRVRAAAGRAGTDR